MVPNPVNHRMALVTWDYFLVGSLPFTDDILQLKNFFSVMFGRSATNSTVGLEKALELSADFRPDALHGIILMTDGENFPDFSGYNASSLALCNTLKEMPNTLVFTIAFGDAAAGNSNVRQFLSDCATGPNGNSDPKPNENLFFFSAPDAVALNNAFTIIVGILKKVQILQ